MGLIGIRCTPIGLGSWCKCRSGCGINARRVANILLVGRSMTSTHSRIETSIPRKHGPAIAGYESDQFHRHLLLEAERRQLRPIIENKSRIILVHTSCGYKHSLREVLDVPNVMNMIKDTKAAQEVRALKDFFSMLSNDPARACYGPKHVEIAHERMVVQTLLMTDDLSRNSDVVTRKKYVNLVNSIKDLGGTAHIFSSMHVSGEQLAQLTGIAAILRFPLPDLEDIEM